MAALGRVPSRGIYGGIVSRAMATKAGKCERRGDLYCTGTGRRSGHKLVFRQEGFGVDTFESETRTRVSAECSLCSGYFYVMASGTHCQLEMAMLLMQGVGR